MKTRPTGGYSDTYVEHPTSEVDLIKVTSDTVLLLHGEGWTEETFAALRAAVRPETLVIHLPDGDTIEALDEDQMRAAGWVRIQP